MSNIQISKVEIKLRVRDIDSKTHDTWLYCHLDLYFREPFKNNLKITHIQDEFRLIHNLDVNMLIDINIMNSEECILDFRFKNMIFIFCKNIEILIIIVRRNQSVNRLLLVAKKTIVFFHINMMIFVKIREKFLSERNYVFNSKENFMLKSEEEFFSHIMINKLVAIQIRNTFLSFYIVSKNFKIDQMHDYQKNEYYLTFSNDKNLTIIFNNLTISSNKRIINARRVLRNIINFDKSNKNECVENSLSEKFKKNLDSVSSSNNSFETILFNEIIVHDNKKIVIKIFAMIDQYLNVWKR
jgi:hypothetical protein